MRLAPVAGTTLRPAQLAVTGGPVPPIYRAPLSQAALDGMTKSAEQARDLLAGAARGGLILAEAVRYATSGATTLRSTMALAAGYRPELAGMAAIAMQSSMAVLAHPDPQTNAFRVAVGAALGDAEACLAALRGLQADA